MFDKNLVKLEHIVECLEDDGLVCLRQIIYNSFFSRNEEDRKCSINFLNEKVFGSGLIRGYLEKGELILVVSTECYTGFVDAGPVPDKYMNVGYYPFEI